MMIVASLGKQGFKLAKPKALVSYGQKSVQSSSPRPYVILNKNSDTEGDRTLVDVEFRRVFSFEISVGDCPRLMLAR